MSTQVQWRRGNTAQTAVFTGAVAEITVDTDKKTLVVHDGVTQGGFPLALEASQQDALAYAHANSAYNQANTGTILAQAAYDSANNVAPQVEPAFIQANAAFNKANSGYLHAQAAFDSANNVAPQIQPSYNHANAAYDQANTGTQYATSAGSYANSAYAQANTGVAAAAVADQRAVTSGSYANSAYGQANSTLIHAESAYSLANTINVSFWTAFPDVNSKVYAAHTQANAAFDKANTGTQYATSAGSYANSAYGQANTATTNAATADQRAVTSGSYANSAYGQANTATTNAATADQKAVSAGSYANSAYGQANTAIQYGTSAGAYANAAYAQSNAHNSYANTTYFAKTGGTISGSVSITNDLTVSGNLIISGNTTSISANNLSIDDSIIYLGANTTGNIADIGIVGHFTQGTYQHTGVVRDAHDGKWKFFSNVAAEPTGTAVDFTNAYYDTVKVGIIETDASANIGSITYIGTNFATPLGGATNPILGGLKNSDNYVQMYVYNTNNGVSASSDLIAYPNNGTDTSGWIDVGITSNAFACTAYSITGPNEGYIFMSGLSASGRSGNLVFATDATGVYNSIEFYVGGYAQTKGSANVKFTTQASSTSTTTGAAIVKGGLGVTNNLYADAIYDNGTRTSFVAAAASSYANSAYSQANTATTNAATADQKAVSAGSYANSAYTKANTSIQNTSGSMSGTLYVDTVSSNTAIIANSHAEMHATAITTASVTQVTLDSWATATYRSAKYFVQMTSGSAYHVIELSLIHDGTTVYLSQYGEVKTGASLGTFDATISTGTLSVLFTPTNAATTVKCFHMLVDV